MSDLDNQRDWRPQEFEAVATPEVGENGGEGLSLEPCRLCGQNPARDESYMYVMSFLIITRHKEWRDHLCRSCSTKTAAEQLGISALLGWWGFPWGLMTIQALQVNLRTLWRWSRLPRLAVVALVLAGLAVPVGVGWAFYASQAENRVASKTGDYLPSDVVRELQEGHALVEQGEVEKGMLMLSRGLQAAPESSAANYTVADGLSKLGRWNEAEEPARKATILNPDSVEYRWFYAVVLLSQDKIEEAQQQLLAFQQVEPKTGLDSTYMADLALRLDEPESALRLVDQGLQLSPRDNLLLFQRLQALAWLDRLEEAVAQRAMVVNSEEIAEGDLEQIDLVLTLRQDPIAGTQQLLDRWSSDTVTEWWMPRFIEAANLAGALDSTRQRVIAWLNDPSTSAEVWQFAAPWFSENTFNQALDRYLDRRLEAVPGLMRLQSLRAEEQAPARLALTAKLRQLDHPLASYFDQVYYQTKIPFYRSADEIEAAIEHHLAKKPDHPLCLLALLSALPNGDLGQRAKWIDQAEAASSAAEPNLHAMWESLRIEMLMNGQDAARAEERLRLARETLPVWDTTLDFDLAEAAFHQGNSSLLATRLQAIEETMDQNFTPAALVLRWSDQMASGDFISWSTDTQRWLQESGELAKSTDSATGQAILVVEGLANPEDFQRRVGIRSPGIRPLIAFFKASNGLSPAQVPWDDLRKVADSTYAQEFAPRIARTILERITQRRKRAEGREG